MNTTTVNVKIDEVIGIWAKTKQLDFISAITGAYNLLGTTASILTAFQFFKNKTDLVTIISKLDQLFEIQYEVLGQIKTLFKFIPLEIDKAFIKYIESGLRANQLTFKGLCAALDEKCRFPKGPYNLPERAASLAQDTITKTYQLAGDYGRGTYVTVYLAICTVDSMLKVSRADKGIRLAFFKDMADKWAIFGKEYGDDLKRENDALQSAINQANAVPKEGMGVKYVHYIWDDSQIAQIVLEGEQDKPERGGPPDHPHRRRVEGQNRIKIEGDIESGYRFFFQQCDSNCPPDPNGWIFLPANPDDIRKSDHLLAEKCTALTGIRAEYFAHKTIIGHLQNEIIPQVVALGQGITEFAKLYC